MPGFEFDRLNPSPDRMPAAMPRWWPPVTTPTASGRGWWNEKGSGATPFSSYAHNA